MFVFGVCAGPDKFDRIAGPSIEACREPDSRVIVMRGQPSIAVAYNQVIDQARGAEGLVLIHDDVQLRDQQVCTKLRTLFDDDPEIAVAGVIGARGVTSIQWWRFQQVGADYERRSGGNERYLEGDPGAGTHLVDAVDGVFLALSPWAIEHLRFDEGYPGFDGYDADLCAQARAAGKRISTVGVELLHDTDRVGLGGSFVRAGLLWQAKWQTTSAARRALLRTRARMLPVEFRLRRKKWR